MIEHFLSNPFRNVDLGDRRLVKYTTVHVERLRANNPGGRFDDRLAATDAALKALEGNVRQRAQKGAGRKGLTQANDTAIRQFQQWVGTQALVLEALFTDLDKGIKGADTIFFKTFFPKGVTAITRANKANLDAEAAIFLKAAADHQTQVGPELLAQATTRWQTVLDTRKVQLETMGAEEGTQDTRKAARAALADELFLNLLALLTHHYQEPRRAREYFPEAILKEYKGPANEPATPPQG